MSRAWAAVIIIGGATMLLKAAAPIAGSTQLRKAHFLSRLPPAVFAALIVTQAFTRGPVLIVDARFAGLVVALLGAWRRDPPLAVLAAAVVVTAVVRRCLG
jgi:hypothetical protein